MKYLYAIVLGMVCFSLGCGKNPVITPTAPAMTEAEINELPAEAERVGRPMPAEGDAEAAANDPTTKK